MILSQLKQKHKEKRLAEKGQEAIDEEDWEDIDEHEREVFEKTGYFDVPDTDAMITVSDQKMLEKKGGERNLADLIMQKMMAGEY